jgi:DNA-binding transcriptional LysR family regulator
VRLTAAGEKVYAACRGLFQTFSDLDGALADIRELRAGKLRIAATTAGEYLLPQLLAHFMKLHPEIDVCLHVGQRSGVLERLASGADDLYLLTSAPDAPPVAAYPILPNPLVALASSDHPLAGQRRIPFARFAQEPMLMREPGSGTRLAAEQAYAGHGIAPRVRMELGSNETIKEAVIAGLGVSLVYRSALGFSVDARRLCLLDVEGVPCGGQWHFVHPLAKQPPAIARMFVEFARSEAARIFDEYAAQRERVSRIRTRAAA